ncbi:MAG TPA: N4-gp56 family major capsid protein [Opitutaceae bacterium]|nr:N4-gp56 family major capsid protein [Opitutaceae bacterium]
MGVQLTTNQTSQYRQHFIKRFLKTLTDDLVLEQFALKEGLPTAQGAKSVSFFCEPSGSADDVLTLAEDTLENSTFSSNDLTEVQVPLQFFGDKQKISNLLSLTSFFDRIKSSTRKMGLSAAIFCDNLQRNAIVTGQDLSGHKRYGGAQTTFNGLVGTAASSAVWTPLNGLTAVTQLKTAKATRLPGGDFITVVPPQVSFDLQQHSKWENASLYSGSKQLFKGELGRLYGTRYVEATNPFLEDSNNGTEGSYNGTTGSIYSVITLGEEAFGFVDLQGAASPMKPSMNILNKADKSDPHNQFTVVSWAGYAASKIVAKKRCVVTRVKTTFV